MQTPPGTDGPEFGEICITEIKPSNALVERKFFNKNRKCDLIGSGEAQWIEESFSGYSGITLRPWRAGVGRMGAACGPRGPADPGWAHRPSAGRRG